MGRGKHEQCWEHVTSRWICKYCKKDFGGGATRIEAHLGLNGKGGGIRRCSKYPPVAGNEGIQNNNNMASTSSNPPHEAVINRVVYSTQDQEVIGTHTISSANNPNNVDNVNLFQGKKLIMGRKRNEDCRKHVTEVENKNTWICNYCNDMFSGGASRIEAHLGLNGKGGGIMRCSNYHEGVYNNMAKEVALCDVPFSWELAMSSVNVSGGNRNVSESENNQFINQSVIDLECEESRGKKRKPEVDWSLEELLADENKPLTLPTEFVGSKLDANIHEVLKLLADDKVFVIGIYGMGGVGKTLLATLVENEVNRKSTFKDVFWVTVSHNYSISKLQYDIAKRIGAKLDEDDEKIRAEILSLAWEKKRKSILILDDVWKYIDLQKVGIHPKVNGIKVILTTRLKHVCHQMDCHPKAIIQMLPLNCYKKDEKSEDWKLFMLKLGHDGTPKILPNEIEKIARCIIERFKGLPLAINVMARTMKGVDDFHQWKHALNKLRKLEMGQEVEEEVFKVLKPSYDNLMEKNLQNCFLYGALLSIEDDEYEYEYVNEKMPQMYKKYEMILKLVDKGHINGSMCLEEIFDEGNAILKKLEAHSLISSTHNYYVSIHPLVRNMAFYILKESQRNAIVKLNEKLTEIPLSNGCVTDLELVRMQNCDIEEIPEGMSPDCPMLSTLIINKASINHIPESFFKSMNNLSILDLSYNERLESLPDSVSELRSLISLVLKGCHSLKHVPPLGEIQALSRLVISNTSIKEAPKGLEKLTNLKWLDLSKNMSLNLELRSFSSYLIKLQYLDLRDTHVVNMVDDVQGMTMLECFGGAFDYKCFNQSMQKNLDMSFEHIKTYNLILGNVCSPSLGDRWHNVNLKRFGAADHETKSIQFGDCDHFFHILPKDLTCLFIIQNNHWVCLCDALSYNTASSLRKIGTFDCRQMESLFCLSGSCSFCTKIHKLEVLKVKCLKSLTVVCKDVVDVRQSLSPGGIFSCLKEFDIIGCSLIEKLFTPQLVQQLQNLETISVVHCNSMKEIFAVSNSDDNDRSIISLPKLTKLTLYYLRELKIVCKGSISCGSSPEVDIDLCPNLERYPTIERC